jgi:hypothetical protein
MRSLATCADSINGNRTGVGSACKVIEFFEKSTTFARVHHDFLLRSENENNSRRRSRIVHIFYIQENNFTSGEKQTNTWVAEKQKGPRLDQRRLSFLSSSMNPGSKNPPTSLRLRTRPPPGQAPHVRGYARTERACPLKPRVSPEHQGT